MLHEIRRSLRRSVDAFLALGGIAVPCVLAGCGSVSRPAQPMVVVPIEEARFEPVDPRQPAGPQIAVLWGDPAKGPSAILLKIGKGEGPMHYHSSDYHLSLLRGEMKHWAAGEREPDAEVLKPGSYWFQPGGQAHADSCLTDECLMFVQWADRRDGFLADEPGP